MTKISDWSVKMLVNSSSSNELLSAVAKNKLRASESTFAQVRLETKTVQSTTESIFSTYRLKQLALKLANFVVKPQKYGVPW